jgi:hypothetical protein
MAACGISDSGAIEPEVSNPDALDPGQAADPAQPTDPAQLTDPGQADQTAPRQAALPEPYVDTGGSTTASVTTSPSGPRVRIDGGWEPAAYALVTFQIVTGAMSATAEFTVNPAPDASFGYILTGTGSGYSSRQVRLERVPGSNVLQAATTSGNVACGTLASGQPTRVTLAFDGTAKRFDVLIAGARSACTALSTKAAGPVTGFRMMDSTEAGYGGHVEFSDLALSY